LYCAIKITPATTKVLECTKALIGVGALIALGSQEIKGNCALLVITIRLIKKKN